MSSLAERLKKIHAREKYSMCDVDLAAIGDAINSLESMQWIPVSERLPEVGNQNYLCLTLDDVDGVWPGDVMIERWHYDHFILMTFQSVTHWMPLPAEPKQLKEV